MTSLGFYLIKRALERGERHLRRGQIIPAIAEFREAVHYMLQEGLEAEAGRIQLLILELEKKI